MVAPVRAFLAIQPPSEIRSSLARILAGVDTQGARLRPVEEENIHLTIEFLGTTPQESIAPLSVLADEIGRRTGPFELEVIGISTFPAERPIVIAASLVDNGSLMALVEQVRNGLADLGFEVETRPFRPHITVARIKTGRKKLRGFSRPVDLTFVADELILFKSDLTEDGAHYTPLHSARFSR